MGTRNRHGLALAFAMMMLLCACAWPHSGDVPANSAIPPVTAPGPSTAALATKSAESAVEAIDASCKLDADCAIKDVGSCCGYYPQCVNKDSPTFPVQVKALCTSEGRMSVCGFPSISGCQCQQGRCAGSNAVGNGKEQ